MHIVQIYIYICCAQICTNTHVSCAQVYNLCTNIHTYVYCSQTHMIHMSIVHKYTCMLCTNTHKHICILCTNVCIVHKYTYMCILCTTTYDTYEYCSQMYMYIVHVCCAYIYIYIEHKYIQIHMYIVHKCIHCAQIQIHKFIYIVHKYIYVYDRILIGFIISTNLLPGNNRKTHGQNSGSLGEFWKLSRDLLPPYGYICICVTHMYV